MVIRILMRIQTFLKEFLSLRYIVKCKNFAGAAAVEGFAVFE